MTGMGDKADAGVTPGVDDLAELPAAELYAIGTGQQPCEAPEIKRAALRYVCLMMRRQGYQYRDIAAELGISTALAHNYVKDAIGGLVKEMAEEVRQVQIQRLETMLAGVMDKAEAGDAFAIGSSLQIMDRIDKLHGIEPPKRVEHTFTETAVNDARNALLKKLSALSYESSDSGSSGNADSSTA